MKARVLLLSVLAVALMLSGCEKQPELIALVCAEDYPTIYAGQLDAIFGDYKLGERQERHSEDEYCSCGNPHDTVDYYSWKITYTDAEGQIMTVELDNHLNFYDQQFRWMTSQVSAHFYKKYVRRYCSELHPNSHCDCWVGNVMLGFRSKTTQEAHYDTCVAYRQKLIDEETLVPLSKLDYRRLCIDYPAIVGVDLWLDDAEMDVTLWPTHMSTKRRQMADMVRAIIEDMDGNINLQTELYSPNEDIPMDARRQLRYYLHGQELPVDNNLDFDDAVYQSYVGIFWPSEEGEE